MKLTQVSDQAFYIKGLANLKVLVFLDFTSCLSLAGEIFFKKNATNHRMK